MSMPPVYTDLLPCPFCGPQALKPVLEGKLRNGYTDVTDPDAHAFYVRCLYCAAEGGWAKNAFGAARLWNTRAT